MTKEARNKALLYYAAGEGDAPPYEVLRYLIEYGYLKPDGATLTAKGREIVHALRG